MSPDTRNNTAQSRAGFSHVSNIQNTYTLLSLVQLVIAAGALYSIERTMAKKQDTDAKNELPFSKDKRGALLAMLTTTSAAALVVAVIHPSWNATVMSSGATSLPIASLKTFTQEQINKVLGAKGTRLLFYKEGDSCTVTVGEYPELNTVSLKTDGKIEASLPIDLRHPAAASDEKTQILLGVIPTLLCSRDVKNAFLIGYGSGTTAGALLKDNRLESVIISEIEPAVYEASRYFEHVNNRPLRQEWLISHRTTPVVADARNLLAFSKTPFDIVVSQPAEPWTNGSADLYSLEFWRLARAKLKPHGIFCQWLQLYSVNSNNLAIILRTFTSVFPNVLVFHSPRAGELILVGFENDTEKLDPELVWRRLEARKEDRDLARIGIDTSQDLLDQIVGTKESINTFCVAKHSVTKDGRVNTDNNLITEYLLPTTLFTAADTIERNLRSLGTVTPRILTEQASSSSDVAEQKFRSAQEKLRQGDLPTAFAQTLLSLEADPECAKCHAQLGQILFQLRKFESAAEEFKRSLELNPNQFAAHMLLAESLLNAEKPTDKTVTEALAQFKAASALAPERAEPYMAVAAHDTLASDWKSASANLSLASKREKESIEELILRYSIARGSGNAKVASDTEEKLAEGKYPTSQAEILQSVQNILQKNDF